MSAKNKYNLNLAFAFIVITALFVISGMYVAQLPDEKLDGRYVFIAGEVLLYLLCLAGVALYRLATQRKKLIIERQKEVVMQKRKVEHLRKILLVQQEVVGNSTNMQQAVQAIAKETRKALGAEGCIVELVDGDDIVYYAGSGTGGPFVGGRVKREGTLSGLSLQEGKVLRCDDSETDERVNRAACRRLKLRSMICVPMIHNNRAIGVLFVMSARIAAFGENDVTTLELMAGLLSAALNDAIAANNLRLNNLELEKMATTDGLTGLKNRRTFQESLSHEYDRSVRHKRQLSVIMMDVDHFKKFNDSFGHPAGDAVLQKVGTLLKQLGRKTDCIARYGGEEFVLLLPETSPEHAKILAQRIQQTVAGEQWEHRQVTVSVGVCSLDANATSAADLLSGADKALYAAKNGGRNCVVCAA